VTSQPQPREWNGAVYDRLADPQARWGAGVVERLELIDNLVSAVRRLGVDRVANWVYATPDKTRARLEAAGFDMTDVWLHDEPTRFQPGQPFEDFLETVCLRAYLAGLPEAERRPFVQRVADAMGEPRLDYVRLNIVARRAA
jgi:trans-aconitate 2-methyltransferase